MNLATCQKQSQVTVGISYNIKTLLLYDRLKKQCQIRLKMNTSQYPYNIYYILMKLLMIIIASAAQIKYIENNIYLVISLLK